MHTEKGHRQRVKDRFRKEGLDNFEEIHALELLLFYAIPQLDTKPLARRLLDNFGSFSSVLEASCDALMQVEGVGINVATFLNLLNDTGRYYLVHRDKADTVLNNLSDYGMFLKNFFSGLRTEALYLLCLDAKRRLLCCRKLGEGSVTSLNLSTRQVVETALSVSTVSVILAHNHPGGVAVPSEADVLATKKIASSLASVEIALVDHIVVAGKDVASMVQIGAYDPEDFTPAL